MTAVRSSSSSYPPLHSQPIVILTDQPHTPIFQQAKQRALSSQLLARLFLLSVQRLKRLPEVSTERRYQHQEYCIPDQMVFSSGQM